MQIVQKVYAYITCRDQLLVFDHRDFPEAGTQVPGGTLEHGEAPAQGVLREAAEETSLHGLELLRFLGSVRFLPPGAAHVHERHFFHLRYPGEPGAPWLAGEQTPSDGTEPKVFVCYWVPLAAPPLLIAEMDHFLPQLRASLAL